MPPRPRRAAVLTSLLAALAITFLVACYPDEVSPTPTLTAATETPADPDTNPDTAETSTSSPSARKS